MSTAILVISSHFIVPFHILIFSYLYTTDEVSGYHELGLLPWFIKSPVATTSGVMTPEFVTDLWTLGEKTSNAAAYTILIFSLQANRIGDEITLKGVSLKFMLEINERFSDVTFCILIVKASHGDNPTTANLFNSLSLNKVVDTINKERYSIIAQ
jgi:hypothetical protein